MIWLGTVSAVLRRLPREGEGHCDVAVFAETGPEACRWNGCGGVLKRCRGNWCCEECGSRYLVLPAVEVPQQVGVRSLSAAT